MESNTVVIALVAGVGALILYKIFVMDPAKEEAIKQAAIVQASATQRQPLADNLLEKAGEKAIDILGAGLESLINNLVGGGDATVTTYDAGTTTLDSGMAYA